MNSTSTPYYHSYLQVVQYMCERAHAGGQAAADEGAGWERVARIWAAARSASSREAVRAGGPPALRSMSRRSAGQGRGEGQSEARAAREDIPGVEVEVQD